jgi:hypothetical protein
MPNTKTTLKFIEESELIYGVGVFDYSKTVYINSITKLIVTCPIHGDLLRNPTKHLRNMKCPYCSGSKINKTVFLERMELKNKDKYDYSLVNFKITTDKIKIICLKHGIFEQRCDSHMQGQECPKCVHENMTKKTFFEEANKKHNNIYNYSKTNYITRRKHICIICPEHGEFWQTPANHLRGNKCPQCVTTKPTTEEFIKKANEVHNFKYNYSITEYIGCRKKIKFICNKHGIFEQTPESHLKGNTCPKCRESKIENIIRTILEDNNIKYIYEKRFEWLGIQSIDFYLSDYNIAIECQGEQHFKPVAIFGGENRINKTKDLDLKKFKLCKENNIKLFYFANESPEEYLDKIYLDKNELLEEILKYPKITNINALIKSENIKKLEK